MGSPFSGESRECPLSNLFMDKLPAAFMNNTVFLQVCKFYQVFQELSHISHGAFQRLKRCFLETRHCPFYEGNSIMEAPRGSEMHTFQHRWSCVSTYQPTSRTVTGSNTYSLLYCPFKQRSHHRWQRCLFRPNPICLPCPVPQG